MHEKEKREEDTWRRGGREGEKHMLNEQGRVKKEMTGEVVGEKSVWEEELKKEKEELVGDV